MDNENRKDMIPAEPERQIQLVVNNPGEEEDTIDLGNVFRNFKQKKRLYAWVLLLCMLVGFSAPLLLYQFTRSPLTVSSVVTLRYEVTNEEETYTVTDLTAPDGTELDLNQITSSYVLQTALDGMSLPAAVTTANLRSNISITPVLTEESQRTKEALAGLAEAKNVEAYNQLRSTQLTYQNRFVVKLTNGFGGEDSRVKTEITDQELRLLLDRILTVYNDYLVRNYADVRLPDDAFSVIDTADLDILDSLDELRAGINSLYSYCDDKSDTVKSYRSSQTGRNLIDWMETLKTFRSINVDYLYALVSEKAVTRDKSALLTGWKYQLRLAQNELDKVNESIAETDKILASYKNDEVFISMQESDAVKSTTASTDYYNELILSQTDNYDRAAELKTTIADYTDRITRLESSTETAVDEDVEAELARSISGAKALYDGIVAHMEELFTSRMYTTFEDHSAAQGKQVSFLAANAKKLIIGTVAGAVIGLGIWFLAALAPEFGGGKEEKKGKEAGRK